MVMQRAALALFDFENLAAVLLVVRNPDLTPPTLGNDLDGPPGPTHCITRFHRHAEPPPLFKDIDAGTLSATSGGRVLSDELDLRLYQSARLYVNLFRPSFQAAEQAARRHAGAQALSPSVDAVSAV